MNLEAQVCSLPLSVKLKSLGFQQNSLFYWSVCSGKDKLVSIVYTKGKTIDKDYISAFTVSELFNMLPAFIDTKQNEPYNIFYLEVYKRSALIIKYIAKYVCDSIPGEEVSNPLYKIKSHIQGHSEKLADCLANILIDLLEKKIINLQD